MKITNKTQGLMELKENNFFSYVIAIILVICAFAILVNNSVDFKTILGFVFLIGIAIVIVLFSKKVYIVIDKTKKIILRNQKSLLKETKEEIVFKDLDHVEVREIESYSNDSEGHSQKSISYNILLVLKNKQEIQLNYSSSSFRFLFFKPKSKEQKTGKEIADFLEIPYQESQRRR